MAGRATVFELLTPRGHGGVAVVGVRGDRRWPAVRDYLRTTGGEPVDAAPVPRLAVLHLDGAVADEVLVVDRPGPEILEIHLHGAPAVVAAFERSVGGFAVPVVATGEVLARSARSREQLALALEQGEHDLDRFLADLAPAAPAARISALRAVLARSRLARALIEPRRLVLCGVQNAGKSTLMNRLLFQDRVLTGDLPGLTRDPVREATLLDGFPYEVIDTAGEGPVQGGLDRAALDLARRARHAALLVLVVDGTGPPTDTDRRIRDAGTLVVRSKTDLPPADWPEDFPADLALSCLDPASAPVVRDAIGAALRRRRDLPPAGPVGGPAALDAAGEARVVARLAGELRGADVQGKGAH